MAVEVAGETIRGVVLDKKGKKITINDFCSLKRISPEEDLPDIAILKELVQSLKYKGKKAVYVTALARSCELFMDRKKVAGMSVYQLSESAKWEIEPYTGITGNNAFVGVEKEKKAKAAPGEIVYEEDTDEIMVNISAIERNVYVAIKERFKAAGLQLKKIYPPEVSFYMPLFLQEMETPQAILEVGQDYSNFALFKGPHPQQISTLNFSCDAIRSLETQASLASDLESSLRFTFSQAPEHEPVVLTGPGAADPDIVKYLSSFSHAGALPLLISKTSGVTARDPDPADAVYGTAIGAGIRQLKASAFQQIGIDDQEPFFIRVKKNAYIMPLVATGFIAFSLLGHNQYMKHQNRRFESDITEYTRKIEKNQSLVKEYDVLLEKSRKIQSSIRNYQNKINYISKEADKNITALIQVLETIAGALPDELILEAVSQEENSDTIFIVKGTSGTLKPIGSFAAVLQQSPWCKSAVIQSVAAEEPGRLHFKMRMTTTLSIPGDASAAPRKSPEKERRKHGETPS